MSPKARHAKGQARVNAYESLLSQEFERLRDEQEIYIPAGPRLGDVVVDFAGVSKAYGDRTLLEGFSASIPPGSIVGVIGPNGAGKTTLLRMITGQEPPDAGTVTVGETVQLALRRPVAHPGPREDRLRGDLGRQRDRCILAGARSTPGPTAPRSTSSARTSRRRWACSRAASATACTWPRR